MQLIKPLWVSSEGHPLYCVDIHPDGTRFATGGQGGDNAGRISIWNMKPVLNAKDAKDSEVPKLLSQMDHHLGCVNCLRWSHDGTYLASGGDDKLVMIWKKSGYGGGTIFGGGGKVNVESWRCAHTLRGHGGDVLDLAWAPGDTILATASVDNTILIWNAEEFPQILKTLKGHSGLVKGVVFDPVGKFLASQSDDHTLKVWRISDWREEESIREPFVECGATTHVLRPGWSPDGSMIVSAHAMNGGGPTAQIIQRDSWKLPRDFVGHKKAVTSVRFNSQMFQKKDEGEEVYVMCALGSRDRSFSVWSNILKRPFFVISDAFDQSVLDLSWSKDGKVLIAASMDGSIAAVVLEEEIGKPISEAKKYDIMTKNYGSSFGITAVKKKKNNGAVFVENPELLAQKQPNEANIQNGTNGTTPIAAKKKKSQPKGPLDKQIEARTSDGKRRITPIYIPPDADDEPGAKGKRGAEEFGSSSTQEKSKITIEKRTDIVQPNISPGKVGYSGNSNDPSSKSGKPASSDTTSKDKPKEDPDKAGKESPKKDDKKAEPEKEKVNVLTVKRKDPNKPQEPPKPREEPKETVNTILVKRKPGNIRKRPVISDSSEDEDETPKTKSSNESNRPASTILSKPKDANKPDLAIGIKRPAPDDLSESPKHKKRGRPPGSLNRVTLERMQSYPESEPEPAPLPPPSSALKSRVAVNLEEASCVSGSTFAVLEPMRIDKGRTFSLAYGEETYLMTVKNRYQSVGREGHVHYLKCETGFPKEEQWSMLFSSEINAVVKCQEYVIVACLDASFHVFDTKGERRLPVLMMPSTLSKICIEKDSIAAVTTSGRFFLWKLGPHTKLEVVHRNECILALLQHHEPVSILKLNFSESKQPVILTSAMKSYTFCPTLGTWIKISDAANSVQALSNYSSPSGLPPTDGTGFQLLSTLTLESSGRASLQQGLNTDLRGLANLSYCSAMKSAAEYVNSPAEYKYWYLNIIRHLSGEGLEQKLRKHLDELLKPSGAIKDWESELMGVPKADLLQESLKILGSNVHLQRLHMEYSSQLNNDKDTSMEIDSIFNDS